MAKHYVANTALAWPARQRQVHAYFRSRAPGQLLTTAAPWTSPWFTTSYQQNSCKAAYSSSHLVGSIVSERGDR